MQISFLREETVSDPLSELLSWLYLGEFWWENLKRQRQEESSLHGKIVVLPTEPHAEPGTAGPELWQLRR